MRDLLRWGLVHDRASFVAMPLGFAAFAVWALLAWSVAP